ncbi:MAG: hypothetical protein JW395_1060 [Nitrospira sp.]|nr:hypothetical protein [Nitrospira sp.]
MAITTDRDVFLGIHVTQLDKDQLKEEADRRKMSVSALASSVLSNWLLTASEEELAPTRSNKRGVVNSKEEDVPLNFEG